MSVIAHRQAHNYCLHLACNLAPTSCTYIEQSNCKLLSCTSPARLCPTHTSPAQMHVTAPVSFVPSTEEGTFLESSLQGSDRDSLWLGPVSFLLVHIWPRGRHLACGY